MILDLIQEYLPEGWCITHIISLEPEWQVNAKDDEHVVVATGDSIDEALGNACDKIANHQYHGRLFELERMYREPAQIPFNLALALGIRKPQIITRRR